MIKKEELANYCLVDGSIIQILQYEAKLKDNKGIQQKFAKSELMTLYMNPQIGPLMNFGPILEFNEIATQRLKTMKITSITRSKIEFISTLNDIIHEFVHKDLINMFSKASGKS